MTTFALDGLRAIREISADVCEEIFQPPPQTTVSQWADANRLLPRTSAEPGRWRTDRVPYLRQIMDTLGDETVREVVFVKSAQVGGTSAGENFIGYLMDQAPCGILMLWPTEKKLRSWSRKQLKPLTEDTECLAAKFPQSGRRDSGNTIASKEFPGGFLQMLTAKSTSDLRSTSARVGVIEEVDEIDAEIRDQGDPIEQFDARFRTFWNSKIYKVSTPTLEGSRIWGEWEKSTQHRYFVPCPHCGHRQILRWRDGKDDQDESGAYRLIWDEDDQGEVIPGSTAYLCESCSVLIEEHHKMGMLLAGEWVATHPGRYIVGFHVNTLYSPLCSWDDVARAFKKARASSHQMQPFVNLWLGLPYREPGSQLDAHFLSQRAESYGEEGVEVPRGVGVVTAGVDVQGDRLELFLWGFGAGEESWFIGWEIFEGDPGQDDVWAALDRRLLEPLRHASGAPVPISAACVDANYQTERVHRFCDPRNLRHVVPTIGRSGRPRKLIEAPNAQKYKRARNRRRPSYVIGTDPGKDLLASRLRLAQREDDTYPPGFVHFPVEVDPVFFDQLTAERLVTRYKAGRPIRVWEPIEGRRNEATDGAVYAMAALQLLALRRALDLKRLGERATEWSEWTPPESAPVKKQAPPPRRGGGFVNSWR